MKKRNLFGWLAMATMLVGTSCSTDEVVNDYSPENAIQFGTYVGRDAESRVSETTAATLQQENWGFGVFANYQKTGETAAINPNFMNNQKVTWSDSNGWEYSPVKYWPNNSGDQVTFWAYAPWKTENITTTGNAPTFKIYDGIDYVAAQPLTYSKSTVDNKVKFDFKHMMSKVGFKVEAIIDELEEHNDNNNGKVDETDDSANKGFNNSETKIVVTEVNLKGTLYLEGTYTWDNNGWRITNQANQQSKTHTLTATNFSNTGYYAYENDKSDLYGQLAYEDKNILNNNSSYLMLVPQTAGINITVKYSVVTRDESLTTGYSRVDNEISSGDFNFTFEGGKAYDFVLHLGLTSVKLDADVSSWDNTTGYIVNVPLNIPDNNNNSQNP